MQNSLWWLREKAEPHWYLMYHLLMVRHGFLLGLRKTVLERLRRVGHQQLWGLCSHRPRLEGWKGWKQRQPDVVESAGFGDGIDSAPSTVSGLVLLSAFLDSHSTESNNRMMGGVERPTSYANSVCLTLGKMMRLSERTMYSSRKELLFLVHSFMWIDGWEGPQLEKQQSEFHDPYPFWKHLQVHPAVEKAGPFYWVRIRKFKHHSPCSGS